MMCFAQLPFALVTDTECSNLQATSQKTRPSLGRVFCNRLEGLPCADSPAFFPGFAEPLQLGHQRQTDEGCRKASVV